MKKNILIGFLIAVSLVVAVVIDTAIGTVSGVSVAMAGVLANNLVPQLGVSWEKMFGIDADGLTNATRDNFQVLVVGNDKLSAVCICWYTGSGALTISEFNDLPVGSVIHATGLSTAAIYYHTAATTWKYQVVNT